MLDLMCRLKIKPVKKAVHEQVAAWICSAPCLYGYLKWELKSAWMLTVSMSLSVGH